MSTINPDNPNTVEQADQAFDVGGSWELNSGEIQTSLFAKAFLTRANLPTTGSFLDFGCALGDFIPEVKSFYPSLTLSGVDHSAIAVGRCNERFGNIAEFYTAHPSSLRGHYDVIHSSNVVEHLDNAQWAVSDLMKFCYRQYIMTPYREGFPRHSTHRASFFKDSFDELVSQEDVDIDFRIFRVPGAWGRDFGDEVFKRFGTLFRGDPFTEARKICYCLTKKTAPPPPPPPQS